MFREPTYISPQPPKISWIDNKSISAKRILGLDKTDDAKTRFLE
jgi:hypothetical protein